LLSAKPNQMKLSVLLTDKGGIIDDCIITNKDNHVYMVVNGACKEKDLEHMRARLAEFNQKNKAAVKIEYLADTRSLLALQGPKAAEVLSMYLPPSFQLSKLEFMTTVDTKVNGIECWVSRCGYTGEDGFEISVASKNAESLMTTLLKSNAVHPAGLGVRDSLRLEAGLCLYGHDLSEDISPVEAGLTWLIGKRRRENGGFLGYDTIRKQLRDGVSRKRVGFMVEKGAPAREGAEVKTLSGETVGTVTSGTFSPSLKKPVAMGYISSSHSESGTPVHLVVRGRPSEGSVVKMPFVPTRYYKLP